MQRGKKFTPKTWPKDEQGRTVVTLDKPVTIGTQTYTEVRMREFEAGFYRDVPEEGRTMGDTLDLIARISELPPAVINKLGRADLMEVSALIEGF